MIYQKQVCTLYQADKLKELGISQIGLFCFIGDGSTDYLFQLHFDHQAFSEVKGWLYDQKIQAFTVAELGVMLPQGTRARKCDTEWEVEWADSSWEVSEYDDIYAGSTEAAGRAEMLIDSIQKGRISVTDCNYRLEKFLTEKVTNK